MRRAYDGKGGWCMTDRSPDMVRELQAEVQKTLDLLARQRSFYDEFRTGDYQRLGRGKVAAIVVAEVLTDYYTCAETLFWRVSQFFENNLPAERWHAEVLRKMTLSIPGVRERAVSDEAYLRLIDVRGVKWQNRAHFFAMAAQLVRHILVDAARERGAKKRGGDISHVQLDEAVVPSPERGADLLALDAALTQFAKLDPRKARVVELRYFGGLTIEETAEAMGTSPDKVRRDWRVARLWLLRQLETGPHG